MSREQETDPLYKCTECGWRGDDYLKLDDVTTGGTAVCPECEGQLTI